MSKKNDLTAGSTVLNLDQIANAVLHRLKGRSLGLLGLCTELGIPVDTKYRKVTTAGSDANCIFHAALLLVVRNQEDFLPESKLLQAIRSLDMLQYRLEAVQNSMILLHVYQ